MVTKIFKPHFLITTILFVGVLLLVSGCGKKETTGNTGDKQQSMQNQNMDKNNNQNMDKNMDKNMQTSTDKSAEHIMIKLPSMQCKTCKKNIEKAVNKVSGIIDVKVDVDEKVAHINYDKSKTDLSKIENAITMAGYDANDRKADKDAYSNLEGCCKLPKDRINN